MMAAASQKTGRNVLHHSGDLDSLVFAAATGGRFNPAPREVFDAGGRSIRSTKACSKRCGPGQRQRSTLFGDTRDAGH
jgi:hypothetical protein